MGTLFRFGAGTRYHTREHEDESRGGTRTYVSRGTRVTI